MAYDIIQIDNIDTMFTVSARGVSAAEKICELLNQHCYMNMGISISCVPLYHLEPNTRIYVNHPSIHAEGEFLLTKINIPLAYNGTMNLTASSIPKLLK